MQSWTGGRLVVRAAFDGGAEARGFVSVAAFADVTRRAGLLAPRMFALLAGIETPADVAAILSWFHDRPEQLAGALPGDGGGSGSEQHDEAAAPSILVADLAPAGVDEPGRVHGDSYGVHTAGWARFMAHVFAAFREHRGPFGLAPSGPQRDDVDDEDTLADDATPRDPTAERSLATFERLLGQLLHKDATAFRVMIAFDLTQYVCERLQSDEAVALGWPDQIVAHLVRVRVPAERRADIAAAVLMRAGIAGHPDDDRLTRACLLALNVDLSGEAPPSEGAYGFGSVLAQAVSFRETWDRLKRVRTYPEMARAYLAMLNGDVPPHPAEIVDWARKLPKEWPVLLRALGSADARRRILVLDGMVDACPKCNLGLPRAARSNMRTLHCASAKNCCDRILIVAGAV